jgi:hypothetical protein
VASFHGEQPGVPPRFAIHIVPRSGPPPGNVEGTTASAGVEGGWLTADERTAGGAVARAVPDFGHAVSQSVPAAPPSPPSLAYGAVEEIAVCELCGLVVREPAPPACPACGGGFG